SSQHGWSTWLLSRRGQGMVCLLLAGCLFAAGGQYKIVRVLHGQAAQVRSQGRLLATLQEPLNALAVQVYGPDPLSDRLDACFLRLRVVMNTEPDFVSEVPWTRMKASVPAEKAFGKYYLPWRTIVENTPTERRATAGLLARVQDWRRVGHIE